MTIPLLAGDPHDEALRSLLKPAGWVNPTPASRYQLVVIGGGPAGLVCAAAAAGLGAKVALIERDLLGGDCLNVGCIPSKAMLRAAKIAADIRRAREFGISTSEPQIDFAAVMERVRRVRAELAPIDSAERYRSLGVDVFLGDGKFVDGQTVEVNGARLAFVRCVIATGSRPMIPELPGLSESRWYTNETIFSLTELPHRLLVLGSGATGCELAQAFARLGAQVTLMARSRVLRVEEPEAGQLIESALRGDGVEIVGQAPDFRAFDAVLVATGRLPNVGTLGLEAAGVQYDAKKGITVDDYLRTSNPRVFAAGDVAATGLYFTHAADAMARLVVRNALFPTKGRRSAWIIPWSTFTDPEVGRVGLNQEEAKQKGIAVDLYQYNFSHLDRAATDGATGFIQVLTKRGTDQIVGATTVGPGAGELIGTLSVAMTNNIGLKGLANTIFPYPTLTEAIKKVADQYNRTWLTPRAQWLIGKWLKWFR